MLRLQLDAGARVVDGWMGERVNGLDDSHFQTALRIRFYIIRHHILLLANAHLEVRFSRCMISDYTINIFLVRHNWRKYVGL